MPANKRKNTIRFVAACLLAAVLGTNAFLIPACQDDASPRTSTESHTTGSAQGSHANSAYIDNGTSPDFSDLEGIGAGFEQYSDLDALGRCGKAVAYIGLETMPTGGRESISKVKPSGWNQAFYNSIKSSNGALYNRCHLIAFSLAGENANERNLITGTSQLNTTMKQFEDIVRIYVQGTGNHVLYRITPDFQGNELVARGVRMEALSVEDHGEKVCFDVYIPNVQDGIEINYANGDSWSVG